MARFGVWMSVATGALMLGAWAQARHPQLSPENRAAQAIGPLIANVVGEGGQGSISIALPSGEVLRGRFKVTVGGSIGPLGSAHGIDPFASGGAYESGYPIENGHPGVADMKGPRGTTAHCEFINNIVHAHGSGMCQLSSGAKYRVTY